MLLVLKPTRIVEITKGPVNTVSGGNLTLECRAETDPTLTNRNERFIRSKGEHLEVQRSFTLLQLFRVVELSLLPV